MLILFPNRKNYPFAIGKEQLSCHFIDLATPSTNKTLGISEKNIYPFDIKDIFFSERLKLK
jgi:hypothetical protein